MRLLQRAVGTAASLLFSTRTLSSSSRRSMALSALAETGKDGSFVRTASSFRDTVGDAAYPAEAGRYHLYVCHA
jgi:glutathionyl-hydroquinone reductase